MTTTGKVYRRTEKGKRKGNQDDCLAYTINGFTLLAVADGMGGYQGGEVASKLAIEAALNVLIKLGSASGPFNLKRIVRQMFQEADQVIGQKAKDHANLEGMGTTLCLVLIKDNRFAWGNLGDSRIYYFSRGGFRQITTDHSYLQEYISEYGPDDVPEEVLRNSHQLSKALDGTGAEPDVFPENHAYMKLNKGEAFLLCSDGLIPSKSQQYELVFTKHLVNLKNLRETGDALVELADAQGSTDNITLVLWEYGNVRRISGQIQSRGAPSDPAENIYQETGIPTSGHTGKRSGALQKRLKPVIFTLALLFLGVFGFWLMQKLRPKDQENPHKLQFQSFRVVIQQDNTILLDSIYDNQTNIWDPLHVNAREGASVNIKIMPKFTFEKVNPQTEE